VHPGGRRGKVRKCEKYDVDFGLGSAGTEPYRTAGILLHTPHTERFYAIVVRARVKKGGTIEERRAELECA